MQGDILEKDTAEMTVTDNPTIVESGDNPLLETAESAEPKADLPQEEENVDVSTQLSQEVVGSSQQEEELVESAADMDMEEEIQEEADGNLADIADYSSKSKEQLINIFEALLASESVQSLRQNVEAIKVALYKKLRVEFDDAKRKFTEEGGLAEQFQPPIDKWEARFKELFGEYRKKRNEYIAGLERSKEDALAIKVKIIDDLKELVNSSETLNHTFSAFRDLQQRWRETGAVPIAQSKDIWERYNLAVENFYSYIKINKELRDLDLKHNLKAKQELCDEAEALISEPNVIVAFGKLQKLHDRWREAGPVVNEHKEAVWERFKEASSRINKLHQTHFEEVKEEQKRNLELKTELCVKAEELVESVLTNRKEWVKASEQIEEIQKVWKTIGFAPKRDNNKIYERFRAACDKFFDNKHAFYLSIKSEMDHNLALKEDICQQAENLSESQEWNKATEELISLQKRWREIGPVPRRYSDAVWKRFRASCDKFFERKSGHFSGVDSQYETNLQEKRALLDAMAAHDLSTINFDTIKEYQRQWSQIGYVPIKMKDAISKEYKEIVDKMFNILRSSNKTDGIERFKNKISTLKTSGDSRLRHERERLYNKVRQLEQDIALLENNIGFFSKSKNADKMIEDVKMKINRAREEMAEAIEKVKLIDKQE